MAGVLKSSDCEFHTTAINMPRLLMDEVDIMQEQKGNVGRDTEILRKSQKEMPEAKTLQQKLVCLIGLLGDWK